MVIVGLEKPRSPRSLREKAHGPVARGSEHAVKPSPCHLASHYLRIRIKAFRRRNCCPDVSVLPVTALFIVYDGDQRMKNGLGNTGNLVKIALVLLIVLLVIELLQTILKFAFGLFTPVLTLALVVLVVVWLWKRF